MMRQMWWKILAFLFVLYSIIMGFLGEVPAMDILNETIRNLYFHVPMWFTMICLFSASAYYAIIYLRHNQLKADIYSAALAYTGIFFSVLGMLTGMEWAKFTWGFAWSNDPKELATALCMLTYFAYWVLRGGIADDEKRAKISAVYNIFIFALMIPLIFVLPRMVSSLHPGNGGNPAFGKYDLDNNMRWVFYPAVIGWIMMGFWLSSLTIRLGLLKQQKLDKQLG